MSEMAVEAPIVPPKASKRDRVKRFLAKALKQADIKRLQIAEQYLRARTLRLLALETLGALAAFHGVELYSHRVAFILLGAGVIFAVERQ